MPEIPMSKVSIQCLFNFFCRSGCINPICHIGQRLQHHFFTTVAALFPQCGLRLTLTACMPTTHPRRSPFAHTMPVLAILALLGSLISLCAGTSYAKQLFPVIGAAGTTSYRLFFSAMLLTLLWRPWRRHWGRADLVPLLLYGGTLGCMNLFFYLTLETIPFGLALAIEFTGPLAVALWSSKRKLDFVWIALAAMGLAYLLPWPGSASNLDPRGIGFALLASLCWALYIVFGKEAATRYGGFATPMGILIAALVVTPVGIYSAGSTLLTRRCCSRVWWWPWSPAPCPIA
jgi:threonine/homoserine efflux transporter RhtA